MSLIIQETRIVDPKFNNCACGSEVKHSANLGSDGLSGYAQVECKRCGLKMEEHSYTVGYEGISLEGMYQKVCRRWNETFKIKGE